jgi:chemotaxis protein methyltransferase CheR
VSDLVERFRAVVANRLGLTLEQTAHGSPAAVLAGRLAATSLAGEDYLSKLERAGLDGELGALAQQLTVGETYLFRNAEQFRALTEVVLPSLVAGRSGGVIRILSAGCASGDEPYSIAIAAREALPLAWTLAIRAVDANGAMLARARRARYRPWSLRETPEDIQRRYFRAAGPELVLDDAVRSCVSFEQRNLADDDRALWAPASYEVVFCRNVIMYFAPEVQRAVVDRIARALVPGGYVFLGYAETLRGISQQFELCHSHAAFYYRRLDAESRTTAIAPIELPAAQPSSGATLLDRSDGWFDAIHSAAARIAALTANPARDKLVATGSPAALAAPAGDDLAGCAELIRRERYAEALGIVERLPEARANQPDALLVHAAIRLHSGQRAAAELLCSRLLAADPSGPRAAGAHQVLALCCEAAGDRSRAHDHRHTAAYLDPTFAMPRLHLGLAARRAGDASAARRELGHALVLLARESVPRVLLFGGGFDRDALIALCRSELAACGAGR